MTNREMLLECLKEDDWEINRHAASYIECPYHTEDECMNPHEYPTSSFQIYCDEVCKTDWLNKEYEG